MIIPDSLKPHIGATDRLSLHSLRSHCINTVKEDILT